MIAQIVPIHRNEPLRDDGMLFVRTEGILDTMVNAPLLVVGLMAVALTVPLQTSFGSTRSLDLILYSDGSAHISAEIEVDPLEPDFEVDLFGSSIDNFVAVGENRFLLSHGDIIESNITIDTFGSSYITIDYDIHDLISKEGRIWTFSFDSPSDYSLLMPSNSIIVGMNALPTSMDIENDQTKLELGSGFSEVNYIFGTSNPPVTNTEESSTDLQYLAIIGGGVAAAVGGVLVMKRKQGKSSPVIQTETVSKPTSTGDGLDTETIFKMRPEMHDDDKKIVKFISENGGEAFESDLRKKFLQPRTTMWRTVKRLERQGVIEITKKDLQNLVKLKKELEEE
ncbi:MAG: MarR family transcriptional regulator [Nitrosopumilus sp. (ex Thoosa mismalolli)]|nr:MarR family transcriptional regulator [Nitrosopumilus sp. (ex Thoosa mismalolli)]